MCMQMQQHGKHAHEDSTKIQRQLHLVVFLYAEKVVLELCSKIAVQSFALIHLACAADPVDAVPRQTVAPQRAPKT